jgi:hypothetical protein
MYLYNFREGKITEKKQGGNRGGSRFPGACSGFGSFLESGGADSKMKPDEIPGGPRRARHH